MPEILGENLMKIREEQAFKMTTKNAVPSWLKNENGQTGHIEHDIKEQWSNYLQENLRKYYFWKQKFYYSLCNNQVRPIPDFFFADTGFQISY